MPYPVDGPKISLGLAWFGALISAASYEPRLAFALVVPVAGLAGLQTGHAWSRQELSDRRLAGLFAATIAASSWLGALGLGAAVAVGTLVITMVAAATTGPDFDSRVRLSEVLVRSSLPAGIAAGSLLVLASDRTPAFVSLVLLISAYEMGDFLVGSGSANAVEGPMAGLMALTLVAVGVYLVLPEPFTTLSFPLYAAVAAVCAPLGQIAGSAVMPRGDAWAPALRRLDSYLVVAPLWLLLV